MSTEDFDIPGLADYLHLGANEVNRMAERGQLPGRRIGGQWRFSRPEIHHWLEERIAVADEPALAHMEGALDRSRPSSEDEPSRLADVLSPTTIAIPLAARTKNSVITAMVDVLTQAGVLWDPERMAAAVRARETLHSTALENGVALLHPRRPLADALAGPSLALGITGQGIPFGDQRGSLTDIFFLIASTTDRGHLLTLARLSRLLANPSFLTELRGADDAIAAYDILVQFEQALS